MSNDASDPAGDGKPSTYSVTFRLSGSPAGVAVAKQGQDELDQAVGFFQAGSRCEADILLTPNVASSPVAPAIVCYSFACKLYLKLILRLSGVTPPKIHRLDKLFESLPEHLREKVSCHYNPVPNGTSQLAADLANVSTAFEHWRYQHEYRPLLGFPSHLREIARALHRVVRSEWPHLLVTFENRSVAGQKIP